MNRQRRPIKFSKGGFSAFIAGMFFTCLFLAPFSVQGAPCINGLPCVVPLTPNDPDIDTDGPNIAGAPNAHKNEPLTNKVCDADLLNQMYGLAFIEAEREMVSANAIILKPDSVLEYTCHDQELARAANVTGPLFSESTLWHPVTVPINGNISGTDVPSVDIDVYTSPTYLDDIIEIIAMKALKEYVNVNFWHDFLGGTAVGDNNTIADTVTGVSNICDFMYNTYFIAKCSDFALEAPYMTFQRLVGVDPRTQPLACPSSHNITQDFVDLAHNKNNIYAPIEPVNMFLPQILAPGSAVNCSAPIPTGVIVQHTERTQDMAGNPNTITDFAYPEQLCANPACHLDNKSNATAGDDVCVQ
ncbi:MAG: hypothetical protein IT559_05235 [Alphaproteobacteria bacterium]|nr:hypothetical protein [Alphaproteobacteria bacterium]